MNKKLLIILTAFVMSIYFYWFQWRPSQIKKSCALKIIEAAQDQKNMTSEAYRIFNQLCLQKYGL